MSALMILGKLSIAYSQRNLDCNILCMCMTQIANKIEQIFLMDSLTKKEFSMIGSTCFRDLLGV